MDTRRGLGASHFDGGFQEIFGQASEVRRGGLKLGFAMQTLEGIRNSWLMFFPVPYEYARAEHQNQSRNELVSTARSLSSALAQNINLVYRAATRLSSAPKSAHPA